VDTVTDRPLGDDDVDVADATAADVENVDADGDVSVVPAAASAADEFFIANSFVIALDFVIAVNFLDPTAFVAFACSVAHGEEDLEHVTIVVVAAAGVEAVALEVAPRVASDVSLASDTAVSDSVPFDTAVVTVARTDAHVVATVLASSSSVSQKTANGDDDEDDDDDLDDNNGLGDVSATAVRCNDDTAVNAWKDESDTRSTHTVNAPFSTTASSKCGSGRRGTDNNDDDFGDDEGVAPFGVPRGVEKADEAIPLGEDSLDSGMGDNLRSLLGERGGVGTASRNLAGIALS
jgi:hypothetical protein